MDISIIIVSYNTADLLLDCLASCKLPTVWKKKCLLLITASTDKSVQMMAERFPEVQLIANRKTGDLAQPTIRR